MQAEASESTRPQAALQQALSQEPLSGSTDAFPYPRGVQWPHSGLVARRSDATWHRQSETAKQKYTCGWWGCKRSFTRISNLNQHVKKESHGEKRIREDFLRRQENPSQRYEQGQAVAGVNCESPHALASQPAIVSTSFVSHSRSMHERFPDHLSEAVEHANNPAVAALKQTIRQTERQKDAAEWAAKVDRDKIQTRIGDLEKTNEAVQQVDEPGQVTKEQVQRLEESLAKTIKRADADQHVLQETTAKLQQSQTKLALAVRCGKMIQQSMSAVSKQAEKAEQDKAAAECRAARVEEEASRLSELARTEEQAKNEAIQRAEDAERAVAEAEERALTAEQNLKWAIYMMQQAEERAQKAELEAVATT